MKKSGNEKIKKKKNRRSSMLSWIIPVAVLALLVVIVQILKITNAKNDVSETTASTLSGTVTKDSIDTVVPGSGTLAAETSDAVSAADSVKVTAYYVENGDSVAVGDKLASVDKVSVMTAIQEVQNNMDSLDEELSEEAEATIPQTITAGAAGRVKVIYAAVDTAVSDTMLESGALMRISMDGFMKVTIENTAGLSAGDSVTVRLSDGTEISGKVDSISGSQAFIIVTDEGTAYGDSVTVLNSDGTEIGSGTLDINKELTVTGFSGTVSSVNVSSEQKVSAGGTLITLKELSYTGKYKALLAERSKLEEQLASLFKMYEDGFIYADEAGVISDIPDDAVYADSVTTEETDASETSETSSDTAAAAETSAKSEESSSLKTSPKASGGSGAMLLSCTTGTKAMLLSTGEESGLNTSSAPVEIPEGSVSYLMKITAVNTDGSWTVSYKPDSMTVTDYTALTNIGKSSELTATGSLRPSSDTVIWSYADSAWSSVPASSAAAGNVLLCTVQTSDSGQTLVCLCRASVEEEATPTPTETPTPTATPTPTETPVPSVTPTPSAAPTQGTVPSQSGSAGSSQAGGMSFSDMDLSAYLSLSDSSLGSSMGGMSALAAADSASAAELVQAAEEVEESYGVSETTFLTITPQDSMSIEISVDELDILSIEEGQTATVSLDALPGQAFVGTVTEISQEGTTSGASSKYTVTLSIPREENMLVGMNASVRIVIGTTDDALTIPEDALVEKDGKVCVYTGYDDKTKEMTGLTEVTTGVSDGTNVQILTGLNEGDTYWYTIYDKVNYDALKNASNTSGSSFMFGGKGDR